MEFLEEEEEEKEYHPKLSKLEEEYLQKAKERHKENITQTQVVAGREFKGQAFISKPAKIIFKDFVVGESYSQKILVTNVSFGFNSFKLLPLSDDVKDFFDIEYKPSGKMSAGLSTNIRINFYPKLNKDINSVFPILAETGKIEIKLQCFCKKAILSVDNPIVDFGEVIYGESSTKRIMLKNNGALSTLYRIKTKDSKPLPALAESPRKIKATELSEGLFLEQKSIFSGGMDNLELQTDELVEGGGEIEGDEIPGTPIRKPKEEEFQSPTRVKIDDPLLEFLTQLKFNRIGDIDGYSTIALQFKFSPIFLGSKTINLMVRFDNEDYSPPIHITLRGKCMEVPIYVDQPIYNLRICPLDTTYREKIVLHNRSIHPMRIQLNSPRELKPYLEFNPTLGYIQGLSDFEIWAKFRPTPSLYEDGTKYMKGDFINIPLKVISASQTVPVAFRMEAQFTKSGVRLTPDYLDFGTISTQCGHSLIMSIENESVLPQSYQFVQLPREISVDPDRGTGYLKPKEIVKLTIMYQATELTGMDKGSFALRTVTSNICNKEYKIGYSAFREKIPVIFDKSDVSFPCLPEKEECESLIKITNSENHSYSFEFVLPPEEYSGLSLTPAFATLRPRSSCLIKLQYHSKFRHLDPLKGIAGEIESDEVSEYENLQNTKIIEMMKKKKEDDLAKEEETKGIAKPGAKGGKPPPKKAEVKKPPPAKKEEAKKPVKKGKKEEEEEAEKLKLEEEREKIEEEERLQAILDDFDENKELDKMLGKVLNFDDENGKSQHYEWLLPCFYRLTDANKSDYKTTFISVKTVTANPTLTLNQDTLDFGEIAVAYRKVLQVVVKNESEEEQILQMIPPTPYGGFAVLNALRTLAPGGVQSIILQFEPLAQQKYEEPLKIMSQFTRVSCHLKGVGVRPEVMIDPNDGLMDFGNVLEGDISEKTFTIENLSGFPVSFKLNWENKGMPNTNGKDTFCYIPAAGTITAKGKMKIRVIFSPEYQSNQFYEKVLIDIPNQINPKRLFLRGYCWKRSGWTRIYKPLVWPSEGELVKINEGLIIADKNNLDIYCKQRIVLEFLKEENVHSEEEKENITLRKLAIGNCRLNDNKLEKPLNFELTLLKDDYFSGDNLKGTVAPGNEAIAKFSFTPPKIDPLLGGIESLQGIGQWVEAKFELKLQGGYVPPGQSDPLIYQIVLRAYAKQI